MLQRVGAAVLLVLAVAGTSAAQEVSPVDTATRLEIDLRPTGYKPGEYFPLTLVNGVDLLEPLFPIVAAKRGDVGRIVLDSALPYGLLITSFAAQGTDRATLNEISRWGWVGIDESHDNYPFLFGLVALGGLSSFLPAPAEDVDGYSFRLRLDRLAVFGLGVGLANAEVELLKPVFNRQRPNSTGGTGTSRPSGHAATAFAAMAFFSDVLRDTFRPQDEPNLGLRLVEEVGSAVPYLGAFYMALERVHGHKHFLTDTFLGGALGIFTTKIFYEWSFLRTELGQSWTGSFDLAYEPGGFLLAWRHEF
jgi:membrane-associated phospholipid phosphatase